MKKRLICTSRLKFFWLYSQPIKTWLMHHFASPHIRKHTTRVSRWLQRRANRKTASCKAFSKSRTIIYKRLNRSIYPTRSSSRIKWRTSESKPNKALSNKEPLPPRKIVKILLTAKFRPLEHVRFALCFLAAVMIDARRAAVAAVIVVAQPRSQICERRF